MMANTPAKVLEIAEKWSSSETSPKSIRRDGMRRLLAGIAFLASAIGVFVLAVSLQGASAGSLIRLFCVPLAIIGVALIPWGIAELLTGRKWQQINPFLRIVFIVIGFPGFIAACVTVFSVAMRLAKS